MARYFFHVSLEGTVIRDDEGLDLSDADAAWNRAKAAALDVMRTDLGRPVDWSRCHFEVTDAQGEVVLEFPFLEAVEIDAPPS